MEAQSTQLLLPLSNRRTIETPVLVKLSSTDLAYRKQCIEKDVEFGESFLKETRSQRIGCSIRDLECMVNYELARHLADEAIVMRLPTWSTEKQAYIDWETINERSKIKEKETAEEFSAFKKHRRESMQVESKSRGKR